MLSPRPLYYFASVKTTKRMFRRTLLHRNINIRIPSVFQAVINGHCRKGYSRKARVSVAKVDCSKEVWRCPLPGSLQALRKLRILAHPTFFILESALLVRKNPVTPSLTVRVLRTNMTQRIVITSSSCRKLDPRWQERVFT